MRRILKVEDLTIYHLLDARDSEGDIYINTKTEEIKFTFGDIYDELGKTDLSLEITTKHDGIIRIRLIRGSKDNIQTVYQYKLDNLDTEELLVILKSLGLLNMKHFKTSKQENIMKELTSLELLNIVVLLVPEKWEDDELEFIPYNDDGDELIPKCLEELGATDFSWDENSGEINDNHKVIKTYGYLPTYSVLKALIENNVDEMRYEDSSGCEWFYPTIKTLSNLLGDKELFDKVLKEANSNLDRWNELSKKKTFTEEQLRLIDRLPNKQPFVFQSFFNRDGFNYIKNYTEPCVSPSGSKDINRILALDILTGLISMVDDELVEINEFNLSVNNDDLNRLDWVKPYESTQWYYIKLNSNYVNKFNFTSLINRSSRVEEGIDGKILELLQDTKVLILSEDKLVFRKEDYPEVIEELHGSFMEVYSSFKYKMEQGSLEA